MTSTEQDRRKYDALADRYEEIYFYVADVGDRLCRSPSRPRVRGCWAPHRTTLSVR